VVPGLFKWLKQDFDGKHPGGILRMALSEFAMYDWHFHPHADNPRRGWASNMWFSLIQQLVRQDIVYWMWHVYLRPDHAWRLISVPDCAKSAYPGECTYIQQPNISVRKFIDSGYGKNFLQSVVSLDNEDRDNCDELLLGMNHHLGSWWEDLSHSSGTSDDSIQKVVSEGWSPEDEERFGIQWIKQIRQHTDVSFSSPDIPQRSSGMSTAQRHTLSGYLVSIDEEHSEIDITNSGSWEELSQRHRDFILPESPTETQTSDEEPFFFGTVRLCGLGAISDTLLGRGRWGNAETIHLFNILFGPDEEWAWKYIQSWRENAFAQYVATFDRIVEAEKVTYGENSFFKSQGSWIEY